MSRVTHYQIRRIIVAIVAVSGFAAYLLLNPNAYRLSGISNELPDYKAEQCKADSLLARDVLENLAVKNKVT